ncbi:transposase [Neobacillus pocheonensis]|uniref:Transposase n=1 Tax=Neobacillus pocheonensis TaxID=363869 RepID=A0ABT0WEU9_9BACI|nr:transposase [Neobacillus pocheonensis]MCM2534589.1 transposase [Neobacillus pocheonensis]MCM2534666.1 transposase [Neobacillus pocheonensis]
MRTKNRLVADEIKYFRPEFSNCPTCQSKLDYCHTVSKKTISTLNGVKTIVNMGYRCTNPECKNISTVFRSAQAEHLSVKHITYGIDVLAFVGELRFKEHKTRKEIMNVLNGLGVVVSERHVQKLYERYTVLLRASAEYNSKEILKETVETHGGIILSMDGVQPEKGNETLYVIREVLSGTILAAKNVKSSSTEELMEFIKPIIGYGFPILGFVSDGQKSIRLAFETLSPETPYQYCQFHYLKDISKPVVDKDRKLKTNIKKKLRGIREIEKKALKEDTLESETTLAYTAAIRSVLLEDGCPPLELPGIKVYEQTKLIQDSLEKCLDKKGAPCTRKAVQNSQ